MIFDFKVLFSNASNTSISCVFVGIFAFFRGLNVHCVQYFHCVFFWLQHFCNIQATLMASKESLSTPKSSNKSARLTIQLALLYCCQMYFTAPAGSRLSLAQILVKTVAARCVGRHWPHSLLNEWCVSATDWNLSLIFWQRRWWPCGLRSRVHHCNLQRFVFH